jgi:hypothetical protein
MIAEPPIEQLKELRNSIFYWMTRNVHTPEGAVQVLGQVKESLTELIIEMEANPTPDCEVAEYIRTMANNEHIPGGSVTRAKQLYAAMGDASARKDEGCKCPYPAICDCQHWPEEWRKNSKASEIWLPIESAPRDGTVILGDYGDDPHTVMFMPDWHGKGNGAWRSSLNAHGEQDWSEPERWMPIPSIRGDAPLRKEGELSGTTERAEAASKFPTSPHEPVSVEEASRKMWERDYPCGGSMYKTYAETPFHDKEGYRREVKFILEAAGVAYVE